MEELLYPSKKFIRRGKTIVNQNNDFNILVSSDKNKELIRLGRPFIFNSTGKIESTWNIIKLFFGLTNFLVVHFYALGAGYNAKLIDDNDFIINYELTE